METRNDIRPFMPVHPGSILKDELKERGIKQKEFAQMIGMQPSHLSALLHGARNISAQLAARIEAVLHIPAKVWLNLQNNYNLDNVRPSELVDGYDFSYPQELVLAQPNEEERTLWSLAFSAGQKDAVRTITKALKELGLSDDQIAKATQLH